MIIYLATFVRSESHMPLLLEGDAKDHLVSFYELDMLPADALLDYVLKGIASRMRPYVPRKNTILARRKLALHKRLDKYSKEEL